MDPERLKDIGRRYAVRMPRAWRRSLPRTDFIAPILILLIGNKLSGSFFYPGDYPVAGGPHQAAAFGLLLAPGVAVADWAKRKRGMESLEPPPVIRDESGV